jgi:hypothetical protein
VNSLVDVGRYGCDIGWMKRCLAEGADPNDPDEVDRSKRTPLHYAAAAGSVEAVKVLLAAGADANAKDEVWHRRRCVPVGCVMAGRHSH